MQPRTVKHLPDSYREIYFLRVTQQVLWLNLVAIGVMALALVIFLGWLVLYHAAGAPMVINSLPERLPTAFGILLVLAILPLHEWIHGLAIGYFGHRARYGIKPLKGVLYATADGALFWRNQYIVVALAPLVVISLIMLVASLFFPAETALWLMFAAALNATGAVGDLWMFIAVMRWRFPPHILVRDEEDGMRVFSDQPPI